MTKAVCSVWVAILWALALASSVATDPYVMDPNRSAAKVAIHVGEGPLPVPVLSVKATQPETTEPCVTCRPAPAVFTIGRSGPLEGDLAVFVRTGGNASEGLDYERIPSSVILPAGKSSFEIPIVPKADNEVEGDETVRLELLPDPSLGPIERYHLDPEARSARVVIRDVPIPVQPVVTIEATDADAAEKGQDGRPDLATFRFLRTGPSDFDLPVRFGFYCPVCLFARSTAENGVDFEKVATTIVIPKGRTFADLVIQPIPDAVVEGDEPLPLWIEEPVCIGIFPPPRECYVVGESRLALATIRDEAPKRTELEPTIAVIDRRRDGTVQLVLHGDPAQIWYDLQASADLTRWSTLGTFMPGDYSFFYTDHSASNAPIRFYRAVEGKPR
jgi:hypothetical protein